MYDDWACNVWATQGECEVNPKFMGASCRKACKKCGSDGDENRGHYLEHKRILNHNVIDLNNGLWQIATIKILHIYLL
jgi:hypothetical protein